MPYVAGRSLRERLARERQLPVDEALGIVGRSPPALDHAHAHGLVHRDIKPENILLHEGEAMVADFGIALAASARGGRPAHRDRPDVGTPEYMSPEQAAGERALDARSDVYSLGCVLYELLAGEPPYTGASRRRDRQAFTEPGAPGAPPAADGARRGGAGARSGRSPGSRPIAFRRRRSSRRRSPRAGARRARPGCRRWRCCRSST